MVPGSVGEQTETKWASILGVFYSQQSSQRLL